MRKLSLGLLITLFFTTAFITTSPVFGQDISSQDFLYRVRHPSARRSWAEMLGKVYHRRRGADTIEAPMYLGILFSPDRTLAQIVIDKRQGYYVGQAFAVGEAGTSIIPLNDATKKEPLLGKFGLRPEDLTMTFLYWKMQKELEGDSIRGVDCRVFLLKSAKSGETVKVWISTKYFFPLKAQWYRKSAENYFRALEVGSFKKKNNYWLISRLELYGPGWRTKVDFDQFDVGNPEKGIPEGLFKKIGKAEAPKI
ncbi:hypothetical protein P0136_08500 [Lentisphaerota bacterium ZTH]|nr:hypothetical protein JYG24_00395 [Lentisphaerota bacterium]WET05405.1 hypothetical protein P0136_08500 [Lentisphaerota bacterium ZTH]